MTDRTLTTAPRTTRIDRAPDVVTLGEWYWVKEKDGRWLGCVTHLGSNYVQLQGPYTGTGYCATYDERVHLDAFNDRCEREENPRAVIEARIAERRENVSKLLDDVRAITARLGVAASTPLTDGGGETREIATRQDGRLDDYSKALVKAEKTDLPKLFERIKHENEAMSRSLRRDRKERTETMSDDDRVVEDTIRRELVGWTIADVAVLVTRTGDNDLTIGLTRGEQKKTVALTFNECGIWLKETQ